MRKEKFQAQVYDFYTKHRRDDLPWRKTKDPYHILVSEVMLQQTQVDRVTPKYNAFLKAFPAIESLSKAKLKDVLAFWQGLGYNRRALMLFRAAKAVMAEYDGVMPKTQKELQSLPGIGPYTAGAVMAFAYNKPVVIIETNIRSVYLHHFFPKRNDVSDKEILEKIEATLDTKNPRKWYWALMDYGSFLKKKYGNPNKKSKHYTRQSTFKGSRREVRGKVIKLLTEAPQSKEALKSKVSDDRLVSVVKDLEEEGFIKKEKNMYRIV